MNLHKNDSFTGFQVFALANEIQYGKAPKSSNKWTREILVKNEMK